VAFGTLTNDYFSFTSFATNFFEFRYSMLYSDAKNYAAGLPLVVVIGLIVFSNFTQKFGKKGIMLVTSGVLCILSLATMYFVEVDASDSGQLALVPVVCFGIWFAMFDACRWPAISMIVTPELSAIAFGLANAVNNFTQTAYQVLWANINAHPSSASYKECVMWLLMISCVGTCALGLLAWKDFNGEKILHNADRTPPKVAAKNNSRRDADWDNGRGCDYEIFGESMEIGQVVGK
jgi:MFS family permease